MALPPNPPSLQPRPSDPSHLAPHKSHQPPPMREVTKGWFTMREEPKTVEQLREADNERR